MVSSVCAIKVNGTNRTHSAGEEGAQLLNLLGDFVEFILILKLG